MGKTKFLIYLSEEQRAWLEEIENTAPSRTATRARILLESDFNNPHYYSVKELGEKLGVSHSTIQNVRSEYHQLGLERTIYPKGTLSLDRRAIFTDDKREQVYALVAERPPYGNRRWTVALLCEESMKRGIFEYISPTAMLRFIRSEKIDLKNPTAK